MVTIRFPSNVKTGGSKTRLNSQLPPQRKNSQEVRMFANAATTGKSCDLESQGKIEAHIDWFQAAGEIAAGDLYPLFAKIEALTGQLVQLRPGKPTLVGKEYQNSGRSLQSVKFAWNNQDADGKIQLLISIPGKVISAMPMLWVREMAMEVILVGLECTRLDAAIDDYGKRLDFLAVADALLNDNKAKFRNYRFYYSDKGGISIRCGSPESPRSTNLYDKGIESKGEIDAYRGETRFGSKLAHDVLVGWLVIDPDKLGDDWEAESAKYLAQSVVGSIDFIDRQSKPNEKNLKRIPRLDWWQEFVDLMEGEIYHTAKVFKPTLEKVVNWGINQVFRTLVCVKKALGDDAEKWMDYQLQVAEIGLNSAHIHKSEQFKKEYKLYAGEVDFGLPKSA